MGDVKPLYIKGKVRPEQRGRKSVLAALTQCEINLLFTNLS